MSMRTSIAAGSRAANAPVIARPAIARPAAVGNRKAGAFSLIELLVVVSVIALLLAIMTPYVSRARSRARTMQCRTNLSALGKALLQYAAANDAQFPVAPKLHNPHTDLTAALKGYVNSIENFYCPSQRRPDLSFSQANYDAGKIGYFYFCCEEAPSDDVDVSEFLSDEIEWPRYLHMGMDADVWVMSDAWFSDEPTAHSFWKKGVNYVRLDCAVRMTEDSPHETFK